MVSVAGYTPLPQLADPVLPTHLLGATPVTPSHSPHPSIGSIRSSTPRHALSLHEYRKQQVTPSPPVAVLERSLKRRKGAQGLNNLERLASPELPAQHHQHSPPPLPLRRLTSSISGPASPRDLQSLLPPHLPLHRSFSTSTAQPTQYSHNQHNNKTDFTHKSSATFADLSLSPRPASATHDSSKVREFKSIRHLPRRKLQPAEQVFATVTFTAEADGAPTLGARPATSSPTISLSKFPEPPRRGGWHLSPLSINPDASWNQQPAAPIASEVPQPPRSAPPTVLHYRGASFDLVNPHHSLQLDDIQTPPGGRDSNASDYFSPTADALNALSLSMSPQTHRVAASAAADAERDAPQRSLYDDFPSAHESITSRSTRGTPQSTHAQSKGNSAFPDAAPLPMPLDYKNFTQPGDAANAKQPKRVTSVKARLSKVWKGALDSFRVMDQAVADKGGELATLSEQRAIAGVHISNQSSPGLMRLGGTHEFNTGVSGVSVSLGNLGFRRLSSDADAESLYPSSIFLGGDTQSLDADSTTNAYRSQNTTSPHRTGVVDSSSELFGTYDATHTESSFPGRSDELSTSYSRGVPHTPRKDSTLQAIVAQYQHMGADSTELSPLTPHDRESDTIPIQFATSAPTRPKPPVISINETFRRNIVSRGSSGSPSPKTPEANVFHTPHGHVIYSSAGVPPSIPLPPMDPNQAREAFTTTLSDVTSGADSYGDTRHLLLLSQQFAEESGAQPTVDDQLNQPSLFHGSPNTQSDERMSQMTMIRVSPASPYPAAESDEPRFSTTFANEGSAPDDSGTDSPAKDLSPLRSVATYPTYLNRNSLDTYGAHQASAPMQSLSVANYAMPDVEVARGARVSSFYMTSSPRSTRSSGVPIMWGNLSPRPLSKGRESRRSSSPGDSWAGLDDDEYDDGQIEEDVFGIRGDENDWETIGNPSRPDLAHSLTASSMAEYPAVPMLGSSDSFPNYEYTGQNRASSLYSNDPDTPLVKAALAPKPLFEAERGTRDSMSLPNSPAVEGLSHMKSAENSATDTETVFEATPTAKGKGKQKAIEVEDDVVQEADASHDRGTEVTQGKRHVTSWSTEDFFEAGTGAFTASRVGTLSALLSAGPNDEIIYNDGHQEMTTDGSNSEPQYYSSPMPEAPREDSFSKVTVLGPKMNITGTPNGTGMKQVGSSLAGLSSPADGPYSTPLRSPLPMSSPPTASEFDESPLIDDDYARVIQFLKEEEELTESPLAKRTTSPSPVSSAPPVSLSSSEPIRHEPAQPISPVSHRFETGNLAELREQKRREREERQLAAARRQELQRRSSRRASVRSQTMLREMRLVTDRKEPKSPTTPVLDNSPSPPLSPKSSHVATTPKSKAATDKLSISTISTHFSHFNRAGSVDGPSTFVGGTRRHDSADTGSPLFVKDFHRSLSVTSRPTREMLQQQAEDDLERKQHHLYPTPVTEDDPELLRRQRIVSWAMFGCAIWFPPFLILMRIYGDAAIQHITGGKITEATFESKRAALWTGIFLCLSIPIVVVLIIVLAHAGIIA